VVAEIERQAWPLPHGVPLSVKRLHVGKTFELLMRTNAVVLEPGITGSKLQVIGYAQGEYTYTRRHGVADAKGESPRRSEPKRTYRVAVMEICANTGQFIITYLCRQVDGSNSPVVDHRLMPKISEILRLINLIKT
jgi:hypothetical protein